MHVSDLCSGGVCLFPSLRSVVVLCWLLWAPASFLLVFGLLLFPFFCVGRYAYLAGGCACLSDAWLPVVVFFAPPQHCTGYLRQQLSLLTILHRLTYRTEPLSLIGHIRGKKGFQNQGPKRGSFAVTHRRTPHSKMQA